MKKIAYNKKQQVKAITELKGFYNAMPDSLNRERLGDILRYLNMKGWRVHSVSAFPLYHGCTREKIGEKIRVELRSITTGCMLENDFNLPLNIYSHKIQKRHDKPNTD